MHDPCDAFAFLTQVASARVAEATRRLIGAPGAAVDERRATFASLLDAASGLGPAMRLRRLGERLALTEADQQVLAFLAGVTRDPALRARLAALTGGIPAATAAAITRCVGDLDGGPARMATVSPASRLVRLGLIDRRAWPGADDVFDASARVLDYLAGDDALDPEVALRAQAPRDALHTVVDGELAERLRHGLTTNALVVVGGVAGSGRTTAITHVLATLGLAPITVEARELGGDDDARAAGARHLGREAALGGRVPVLRHLDALTPIAAAVVVRGLREAYRGPLGATRGAVPLALDLGDLACVQLTVPALDVGARARVWSAALPERAAEAIDLATIFPFAPGVISATATAARASGTCDDDGLRRVARARAEVQLAGLASRVSVRQRWTDLVLTPEAVRTTEELVARHRHAGQVWDAWGLGDKVGRGHGTVALLSGPPGTGKTMLAGLLAIELGLDLYQVDLAQVVSKWVGETESRLAQIFDAAEAASVALLFDEADALFAKRSAGTSSNDRHANREVNYLLQRVESFRGVCLLTTNHEAAIDPAFQRRLAMHLRLPAPGAAERARLWRAILPAQAPVADDVDVRALARRFTLAGGHIRNAVVRAAFLAAADGGAITMGHLVEAAVAEGDALGRVTSDRLAA